jgi:type III pantothenate kinase
MNLIIDVGNTLTKFTVFEKDKEFYYEKAEILKSDTVKAIVNAYPKINNCIVSASGNVPKGSIETIQTLIDFCIEFNHTTPLPFNSHYKTQHTIGLDRLAVIAGAKTLYPYDNVLIIDAGTAITYDIKTSNNLFLGGNISPGMTIRFKALNHFTKNLPEVQKADPRNLIGQSTNEAILNGVINGIIFEMEGMITECQKKYANLTVLLTGGDTDFFDNKLKKAIFAIPNLVSVGLNTILNYNV